MKLLVLFSSGSLGQSTIEIACARWHDVTILADSPLRDATKDDANLQGLNWDVLIDLTGGSIDRDDNSSQAKHYVDRVDRCLFLSDAGSADSAERERELIALYGNRLTLVHPCTVINGAEDIPTLTYWLNRIQIGGEVLAPGEASRNVTLIDSEDLSQFMVTLAESGAEGVFDLVGPEQPMTMRQFLEACRFATQSDATFTWVSDSFLERSQVTPEMLPLWSPETSMIESEKALSRKRALDAGLALRPLAETIHKALETLSAEPTLYNEGQTLTRVREAEILRRWHQLSHPYKG